MHPFMKILKNLTWLTQLGVSVVVPLILCIGGCFFLQYSFSLGPWIMVIGILIGMGAALSGAFKFGQAVLRQAEKESADSPKSYNSHE